MLLRELSQACGGPGQEHEVRDLIRERLQGRVNSMRTDTLGNLIVCKQGEGERPRVMMAAHMDEVCLMNVGLEKNGMLRFQPVGGMDPRVLVAKSVVVGSKKVPGVIGAKPIHLQKPDERKKPFRLEDLLIDIGARKQEEAEKLISIGDYAYFATEFSEIGEGKYKGKAFDDRVGCSLLLDILEAVPPVPVVGVFTVQEEVGLRGALVAAYGIEPDLAIVLEGTTASDVTGTPEHRHATTVGQGPSLAFMDRSVIADPKLVSRLLQLAEKHHIPVQLRRSTAGGTDAGAIQSRRSGVSVATISIPCRYIHSPASIMSKNDYENALALVRVFLQDLRESEVQ